MPNPLVRRPSANNQVEWSEDMRPRLGCRTKTTALRWGMPARREPQTRGPVQYQLVDANPTYSTVGIVECMHNKEVGSPVADNQTA